MKKAWLAVPLSAALLLGSGFPAGTALDNATQNEASAATKKYYFKNNVAKLTDVKIKITKVKFVTKKDAFKYDCFNPVVIFYYETTNLTGSPAVTPSDAWMAVFAVYQDNKTNYMNELEFMGYPERKYDKTMHKRIKKGRTVKNAVLYELSDTKTPVLLKAYKGYDGTYLGKKTYKVKF